MVSLHSEDARKMIFDEMVRLFWSTQSCRLSVDRLEIGFELIVSGRRSSNQYMDSLEGLVKGDGNRRSWLIAYDSL